MKQIDKLTLAFALAVLVMAGCAARPAAPPASELPAETETATLPAAESAAPPPEETGPAAPEIPLDGASLTAPVPDFLDGEQQLLYRQAYSLYTHLLGCETGGVEYSELYLQQGPSETVELNGRTYLAARGPFAAWKDFDAAVHAVFTDAFWKAQGMEEIYVRNGEQLCFLDASRGGGYYRDDSRPDTFTLVEQTEDEISFTLTGYYSPMGEGGEDYTIDFPIRLVRTEAGWRFDEFHQTTVDELGPEELAREPA